MQDIEGEVFQDIGAVFKDVKVADGLIDDHFGALAGGVLAHGGNEGGFACAFVLAGVFACVLRVGFDVENIIGDLEGEAGAADGAVGHAEAGGAAAAANTPRRRI